MHDMSLKHWYYFIQVLHIKRSHPTKIDYFSTHIQFTTIYLLQGQKLNPGNYSKQKIIMRNFVQTNYHYVYMYAKFGGLNFY
jgi:hypothetical protein